MSLLFQGICLNLKESEYEFLIIFSFTWVSLTFHLPFICSLPPTFCFHDLIAKVKSKNSTWQPQLQMMHKQKKAQRIV